MGVMEPVFRIEQVINLGVKHLPSKVVWLIQHRLAKLGDLLRDTSGGAVFYHVFAPDGVFVTGYATPPVPPVTALTTDGQTYFDATYQSAPVRVLRFTQTMSMEGLVGPFTFSVWQSTDLRDGFVRGRTRPVFAIIASMMTALLLIVWFGVRLGLYPLTDLENAIAQRSAHDLSPIRRAIPFEVSGIVGRINSLLEVIEQHPKGQRYLYFRCCTSITQSNCGRFGSGGNRESIENSGGA